MTRLVKTSPPCASSWSILQLLAYTLLNWLPMILDNLDPNHCLPITISEGDSLRGSRIGGTPPRGVFASRQEKVHYLLTLQLDKVTALEISVFLLCDWEFIASHPRELFDQGSRHVEIVVHNNSVRDASRLDNSLLSAHPLDVEPVVVDQLTNEETTPSSGHKLGGRPYLIKSAPDLVNSLVGIEKKGFRQLLQLDFPGSRDADISGDWPFGDGMFNLFFSPGNSYSSWYYFWQY